MKNWANRGVLEEWEEGPNPRVTFRGRAGEVHQAEFLMPFGMSYTPPIGAEAIVMPIHGSHNHLVVTGFTGGQHRREALPGGMMLYSTAEGHQLELTPDGNFNFSSPNGMFFNMSGDKIQTNMTIETTGDIVADGVSLKEHVHNGTQPGAGLSGEPQA